MRGGESDIVQACAAFACEEANRDLLHQEVFPKFGFVTWCIPANRRRRAEHDCFVLRRALWLETVFNIIVERTGCETGRGFFAQLYLPYRWSFIVRSFEHGLLSNSADMRSNAWPSRCRGVCVSSHNIISAQSAVLILLNDMHLHRVPSNRSSVYYILSLWQKHGILIGLKFFAYSRP